MTMRAERPLAGITVVEHASDVAAQYCGRQLAVLGATVIKVEPPGGIAMRTEPPLLCDDPPRGVLFEYLNFGKRAVTCDLSSAQGKEEFRSLLARADVLLDDTPAAERKDVLAPANVHEAFPSLVYASVLPFGAHGERAGYIATDLNLQHAGGEGFLMPNGLALERFPDRPPVKVHGHFAEYVGGMSAVSAVLAAVYARDDAGGQFVDISVQDANVSIGCFAVQRLGDGIMETRHARSFKYGGVLECRDGYVEVLVLEQHQWEKLVEVMGSPEWACAAQLSDPLERGRRGAEINSHLRAWARTQTVRELVEKGQALGVPVSPYNDAAAVLGSDAVSGRGNFQPRQLGGNLSAVPVFVAPYKFPHAPLQLGQGIGCAGADNIPLLGEGCGSALLATRPAERL
jgi:crotonobetainyl-CoA:carnitine CoA-transferase CaiB-like acyl-CoA transferase